MRRFITLCCVVITNTLFACDVCGSFMGITPYDNHSSLSAIYRYKMFNGYQHTDQQNRLFTRSSFSNAAEQQNLTKPNGHYNTLKHGSSHTSPTEPVPQYFQDDYELFTTLELRGKFFIHKRIELSAVIPFVMNSSKTGEIKEQLKGIGDLTFQAGFHVIDRISSEKTQHRLILGGGIKLPVGDYYAKNSEGKRADFMLQPGTGSIDYTVYLNYVLGFKKLGMNFNSVYKINGNNYYNECISNSSSNYLSLFYKFRETKQLKLFPSIQAYQEYTKGLYSGSIYQPATEMSSVAAGAGLDIFYKQFLLNASFHLPVYEKQFDHNLATAGKFMIGITYSFDQKKYLLKSKKES